MLYFNQTAGSKYTQTGMFEVTKAEEEEDTSTSPPASPNPNALLPAVPSTGKPSALRVTIPSELQGVAYIEVLCQKGTQKIDLSMGLLVSCVFMCGS